MDQQNEKQENSVNRRHFLKIAGITTLGMPFVDMTALMAAGVALLVDADDPIAGAPAARWAAQELEQALTSRGIAVQRYNLLAQVPAGGFCLAVAGAGSALARQLLAGRAISIPAVSEALAVVPVRAAGKQVLLACGQDARGLVYALLDLADRVHHAAEPLAALRLQKPTVEQPANGIRSLTRLFVSDVEDKPWYNDREMWPGYLTMLATQRFNRFNLSLGIGYDFLRNVTDGYFVFAYPFFLSVPGYNVRVPELSDAERDHNLEMLRFISEQTAARGMQFQLGLWMHGYEWINSPTPNYTIAGLSPETHGPYCRDAVRALLQACPAISGVTFRVHGESGVNEGSYGFWQMVFEGVATCGRPVEIDMHAKGMDQRMADAALATGLPVTISPKYWAEHLGMPYHQADIRAQEIPRPDKKTSVLMNLSEGSRSFIRYGYGDLLKEDRPYKVLHRIWPGTQRLLLWGDPLTSSAHARAFSFSGSAGAELMEPLSFKGRRGSGIAGDRCGYADASLRPRWDWQKYLYSLRVFGRLLYNPDTEPEVWRRQLQKQFGAGAGAVELALAHATRILPMVLTSHGPSAANNSYWPEMYTNQPIVAGAARHPYGDTPAPKVFGNVSPFDPQLFLSMQECAAEMLKGEPSGKYTPIETAQWLEDHADQAARHLAQAAAKTQGQKRPEYRRMAIDVNLQIGLGRFFGAKFRAGVLYALFEQSGDRMALAEALQAYRRARSFWAGLAQSAKDVYQPDITIGESAHLRGHWLDRLPALDADIAAMAQKLEQAPPADPAPPGRVREAIGQALARPERARAACRHQQPQPFRVGQPLEIECAFEQMPQSALLYYRHVNQAERYESVAMQKVGNRYRATIPAAYTSSPYPIQYYFELKQSPGAACLYPGFNADLTNQPYFLLRQA